MAPVVHRVVRATMSRGCAPIASIVGFSCMLTWLFILYQPSPGPGDIQQIRWQEWEVIDMNAVQSAVSSKPGSGDTQGDLSVPEGTDWWDVESSGANTLDFTSLPLDRWNPLLPHNTVVSEIAVAKCWVDPRVAEDYCKPPSTPEKDAIRGKWVRVDADLNLEGGAFVPWLHIYYRRTRRQDVNLVDKILLLEEHKEPEDIQSGGWKKADMSVRNGLKDVEHVYLWYHVGKTAAEMNEQEKANLITEIDILYGEDIPWYGFEKLEPPAIPFVKGRLEAIHVTTRRGVKQAPKAPPPHFSRDGKYKIMQIADLHFSVDQGECRDVTIPDCVHSDNRTSTLISHILDQEEPDLVIFSGDQLNGQGFSWHPRSVLAKFAKALTERKRPIPWAAVFGNHDDESGREKKAEQVELMRALPYSLIERGPEDVHGEGNYVLKVKSADASKTHLLTLYFLDSGSYSQGILNFWGIFQPTEYDWIRESQINWFLQESSTIKPIQRPFSPDTAKDLGHSWNRRDVHPHYQLRDQVTPGDSRLAKPNALVFFHIPLPESYSKADSHPQTGRPLDVGTHGLEGPGNAKKSDGFFEKAILQAKESAHAAQSRRLEVKAIGNGHSHVTDNCRRVKGIWLCFGGGGSYSGYGKTGFDRRYRIYEISDYGETIKTYKRTEHDEIIDEMYIAGAKAAPIS
ncbi:Metallo-dependent phosphatase-like protein [Flagelloscypha sp. PMI_526]|nr:Metallo-dependent phosphatase-like protein [Flagelloscypha sp. PMI_526]